jgi:hypothetical protein
MEISTFGGGLSCVLLKALPLQLGRVMRLTALLMIVGYLHSSANGYSQTVSFSGKNVPLQTVFASIEKQTGLSFFFNYALIKDTKPVTLDIHNSPVDEALKVAINGQGLDFYKTGRPFLSLKSNQQLRGF